MEEWRTIPGHENYSVSSQGRVRRDVGGQGTKAGHIMSLSTHPNGYRQVGLSTNNKKTQFGVHRLVMLAFVGPCPEGLEVCHNNQIHGDNRVSNLRYDTHKSNCEERVPGVRVKPLPNKCRKGHTYLADSFYLYKGARVCKLCEKIRGQKGNKDVDLTNYCRNGHLRSEAGVYTTPTGKKYCLVCRQNTENRRQQRRRNAT